MYTSYRRPAALAQRNSSARHGFVVNGRPPSTPTITTSWRLVGSGWPQFGNDTSTPLAPAARAAVAPLDQIRSMTASAADSRRTPQRRICPTGWSARRARVTASPRSIEPSCGSKMSSLPCRPDRRPLGRGAGVVPETEPPEPPRNDEQGEGEADCPSQARRARAADQRLGGYGDRKRHRHDKGQGDLQPARVDRDRPAPGLVHHVEDDQNVGHPDNPERERGQDEQKAVDDRRAGRQDDPKGNRRGRPDRIAEPDQGDPEHAAPQEDIGEAPQLDFLQADQELGIRRSDQGVVQRAEADILHQPLKARPHDNVQEAGYDEVDPDQREELARPPAGQARGVGEDDREADQGGGQAEGRLEELDDEVAAVGELVEDADTQVGEDDPHNAHRSSHPPRPSGAAPLQTPFI